METRPEQVEVMTVDIEDNYQLLQSLAKEVEQEEGRGELKVSYFVLSTNHHVLCYVQQLLFPKARDFTVFERLTFPGSKRTRIPLYASHWQKLPLV